MVQSAGAVKYTGWISAEGKDSPNECPVFDSKQLDGEVQVMLELWGMQSSPSLPLHPGKLWLGVEAPVALCRRSARQTIPLSVLARNQTKDFGLEISAWPEVGRERRSESWTKELEEGSWWRVKRVTSRHRTAERRVGMRESPDQWMKSGQDRLAFQ